MVGRAIFASRMQTRLHQDSVRHDDDKMTVPRARLLDLLKTQCQIFSTTFNPEGVRTGNKVLRQRLKGPALAAWYPRKSVGVRDVIKEFAPQFGASDFVEDARVQKNYELKQRGKGAPAKQKTKKEPKKR